MIGPVRLSKVWSSPKTLDTLAWVAGGWIRWRVRLFTQGSVRPFYGWTHPILTAIGACFDLSSSTRSVVEWAIDLLDGSLR